MSYNRPAQGNRNPPRAWGSDRPSGLAAGLPAATAGRSEGFERKTEAPAPRKVEESSAWRSSAPSDEPPRGWGNRGGFGRRDEPVVDDVDDKFARAFSKMATGPAPSSSGRGPAPFEERRGGFEERRGGFDDRRGGDRGGDRDEPRRFGGGRDRERQSDSDLFAVDDKFARAFGGAKRPDSGAPPQQRERREDYPRRDIEPFGGGERSFGGRSNDARNAPRRERDDGEWRNDSRFADKFGGGGRGGGDARGGDFRSNRGDDRGDFRGGRGGGDARRGRDYDPSRFDGPLPTAPKASMSSGVDPEREKEEAARAEQQRLQKEEEEKRIKAEKEAAKAARRKAEEDAKRAKEEAKRAEEEAKNAALNAFDRAVKVTADAIAAGLKGAELTAHLQKELAAPIFPAGVLKSMLASLNGEYTATAWYKDEQFGHALKNLFETNVPAHVSLLYAVQAFCHEKKFPKIKTSSGAEKRLIEVLVSILLNAQIIDIDGLIAWADDENKLDIPGRADAIVQTTTMVATLRQALLDEEEEEDYDDEDFKQQYVK